MHGVGRGVGLVSLGASSLINSAASGGDTAADFSGNGSISIANNDEINTGSAKTNRTVEMWFKPDSVTGMQVLFEEGGEFNGLNIYLDGDDLVVGIWSGGAKNYRRNVDAIQIGETYHVVAAFESGSFLGYLNGQQFGPTGGINQLNAHTGDVVIGGVNAGGSSGSLADGGQVLVNGNRFDGTIDEFALYNSTLSASGVSRHYQRGLGVIPEPAALSLLGLMGVAMLRRR